MKSSKKVYRIISLTLLSIVLILSICCLSLAKAAADFSGVYYSYLKTHLQAAEKYSGSLQGKTLYLNTDNLMQTNDGYIVQQMHLLAEKNDMSFENCNIEEAAKMGLVELNEHGDVSYAGNCVMLSVSDRKVDKNKIEASVNYFIASQGASLVSLSLEKIHGHWIITDESFMIA